VPTFIAGFYPEETMGRRFALVTLLTTSPAASADRLIDTARTTGSRLRAKAASTPRPTLPG
jgi:hypothetical protein